MTRTRPILATAALVMLSVLAAGCSVDQQAASSTAATTAAPAPPAALSVADGHGWDMTGLYGVMPAPGSCSMRATTAGDALPDPGCTPGALDGAVRPDTLSSTICRPGGYTDSVRPPESITGPAKRAAMAAYGVGGPVGGYEYDHLVPLSLGGASTVTNLWPEPNDPEMTGFARNAKDLLETRLWRAVCDGKVALSVAQNVMATDWTQTAALLGPS